MKKHYLEMMSFALVAMTFGSCQLEEHGPALNGEVDFSIRAEIPYVLSTYAQPELQSHLGGYNNLDKALYDLRYILEVWTDDEGETPRLAYRNVITEDDFSGTTFEARLLAKKYKFVFWADFVNQGSKDNLVYNADELTAVTYADAADRHAGEDLADAYYAVKDVDLTQADQQISDVVLKRPFGKIRLVATDKLSGNLQNGEMPKQSKVVYGAAYNVPDTFNALTEKATGDTPAGEYMFTAETEDVKVGTETKTGAYVLGYDYIFASDAVPSYAFDVTVYSDDAATVQIGVRSISDVPVQKNKLTTVIGNFFTNSAEIQVIVEDRFDEPENVIRENAVVVAELQNALNNGTPYTLEQDIVLDNGLSIPAGVSAKIDLNGKKINSSNSTGRNIKVYGELTISDETGEGSIVATEDYSSTCGYCLVEVIGDGHLVMESGNIYAVRNDPVNNGQFGVGLSDGGKFTMKGGRIEAGWYAVSGNGTDVLTNGVINIEGGELISVSDYAIYLPHSGVANITGGTVNGAAGAVSIRRGELNISGNANLYSRNDGDTGDWGDGTGNQGNSGIMVDPSYGKCTVNINGGRVSTVKDVLVFNTSAKYASDSKILVSAGTFSDPTPLSCLAPHADVKVVMERDFEGAGVGIYNNGNGSQAALDIDLGGHKWILDNTLHGSAGTVSQNFHLEKGANITFRNGVIRPGSDCNASMLFQNYSNLTLDNMSIYSFSEDGSKDIPYLMSNNNGNVVIRDTKLIAKTNDAFAFDVFSYASYEGVTVTVEGDSHITGRVEFGGDNGKKNGKLVIKGGIFNGNLVVTPAYYDEANPNIIIEGGTFNGTGWEDYK